MLKKIGIGVGIFVITAYALFLILPFFLSGLVNSYNSQISKMIEDSSGFKVKLEDIRIMTTPKLTAGAGVGHLEAALPDGETFLTVDNLQAKLSLLSFLFKKIEVDIVAADNLNVNLKVKKDGKFLIEDYIPQSEPSQNPQNTEEIPFGVKLSNHLPDITVRNYNISFIDAPTDKTYSIYGDVFKISDFILDKKIKVSALGKVMLQDRDQFSYDVKIFNKVMPELNLHELVFNPQIQENQPQNNVSFNIIEIFKAVHDNYLTADVKGNVTVGGTFDDMNFNGQINASNLGVAVDGKKLPSSNIDVFLKGNKIKLYSKLYTAKEEITELIANIQTGKHFKTDMNCKSNAQFKSIIDMADSIAKSFGYKELDSLRASGAINMDFSLKTDLKKIESSGYIKVPNASLSYPAYNVSLDKIHADIDLANNTVNIKDAGLSVANQPLKIRGTVSQDADVTVTADKLQLKSLMLAAGQMALLKENAFNSGTLSMNVLLKGKLDKLAPKINISIDNVNIKNIPSNTSLILANSNIDVTTDGKVFGGLINLTSGKIVNPAATILAPSAKITLGQKDIDITSAYLLLNSERIDISGKIADYLAQNLKLDITAKGPGIVNLSGAVNDVYSSQKLNLNLKTLKTVSMEIPGFKKSNIKTDFDINILGNAMNPILKGTVKVPSLTIPDMLLKMENMDILLNGPIAKGKGTLNKFVSGGISAENLSSDFNLVNNVFYLKNLNGDAFSGKIHGNISYNLANGHIGVDFKGSDMNAEKAIEGAAGLKNALSGKLNFNANVTLFGNTDIEMMKNLKGNASFEITDGTLGNIGRFENFLFADNISSNSVMRAAVNSISALPAIKNTAQFKTISGKLTFNNGWANLNPVKTTGPSMAYYITGRYNLLNATANVVVLGRLSAEVVKLLGPVGDLSVEKLTSFIPKFGAATAKVINAMTTDPKRENTVSIPALSSGNKNYKDFKVQFNGGVESRSSVKSFKWLSKCDTSAIESVTVKEQVQQTKQAVEDAVQQKKDAINVLLEQKRQQAQESRQQMQNAKEGLKNLKNLIK